MKTSDRILSAICAAIILTIGIIIYIIPQRDFSESENRYLTKLQKPTVDTVLNGDYANNISSFYSDQFPLRSYATAVYSLTERSLGKREIGGVILYGEQLIARQSKAPTYVPPVQSIIIESKFSLFKKNSEELSLYYNTDHHRTTYGAYLIYLDACKLLEIAPYPESYFEKQIVCSDFYGTAFFKSRLPHFAVKPDSIELWRYTEDTDVTLTADGKILSTSGFYDFTRLSSADKYSVFLGGNYALLSVRSNPSKPTLLLVKDSFANAVVPFLSIHFNIDLIDPRYASPAQLSSALSSSYSHKLFIGCLDSF